MAQVEDILFKVLYTQIDLELPYTLSNLARMQERSNIFFLTLKVRLL